jgi:hypothetical protein
VQDYWWCIWTGRQTRHWSYLSELTDHEITQGSGSTIPNTAITGHSPQHSINGPLSSTWWKVSSHSDCGPCEWARDIQIHWITLSHSPMTGSITWMTICKHRRRRRHNGLKTWSSQSSLHDPSGPSYMLNWHPRQVCYSSLIISSILSGSCDCSDSGRNQWIFILRTTYSILPNSRRRFWSMWRMNTLPNINVCQSINQKAYRAAISSPE